MAMVRTFHCSDRGTASLPLAAMRAFFQITLSGWVGILGILYSPAIVAESLDEIATLFSANELSIGEEAAGDQTARRINEVFGSRVLIPQNGVVHVVGPGNNAAEWILPALARPDLRIFVFFESDSSRSIFSSPETIELALEELSFGRTNFPVSASEFFDRAAAVSFETDVSAAHPDTPRADFVLAMMPAGAGRDFARHVKKGGFGWVVTPLREFFSIQKRYGRALDWKPIAANPVSLFLSSQSPCQRGWQDLRARSAADRYCSRLGSANRREKTLSTRTPSRIVERLLVASIASLLPPFSHFGVAA